MIHISKDGTGDFRSVSEALASVKAAKTSDPVTFYLHKGIYQEQITLDIPHVTLIGESKEETVLTFDLYARMQMPDGKKRGTFRTYSCFIDASDFTARNLTFENSAGPGTEVGQALALYVDGDRIIFDNCRFLGNQDTLFTAPLPPKEIEPDGFLGPKQFAPRTSGRHYYKDCYIEGDVDFIFGGATAYFENCELFSKNTGKEINSYVTAASTPEGQKFGYVMKNCRFTSNCPPHSAYLGRPWREFAKTVLLDCHMDEHICPEGWHDWGKEQAHTLAYYAEYHSTGAGATMECRPDWIHQLTDEETARYTKDQVLRGNDHWNP